MLTVVPFITNDADVNSRLLLLNVKGETKAVIIKMYPDKNASTRYFSGKWMIYTVDNEFVNGFRFENSIAVSQFIKNKSNIISRDFDGGELNEVTIYNGYRSPRSTSLEFAFFSWDTGDGGSGDIDHSFTWDSGEGSSDGSNACQEGYIKDPYGNCVLDEQIYNLLGDGPVNCVYDKLLNSSLIFKNGIQKFDGEFPVSHLMLTINNSLPADVYGQTMLPIDYITEIQFNENKFGDLSDLGKATVFAHEIIHAEIFRKMLSAAQVGTLTPDASNMNAQQQVDYVNSMKDNFPGLYDYYYKKWKPTWNHEMMANHYRSSIRDIIQTFDNNRLPRSTYDAVAWLGLGKLDVNVTTIAWDNLSAAEKTSIISLINENIYKGPSNCN